MAIDRITRKALLAAAAVAGLGITTHVFADALTWASTASGTWQAEGAWSGSTWADGADAVLNASTGASASATLTLNAPVTTPSLTITLGVFKAMGTDTTGLSIGSGGVVINGTSNTSGLTIGVPLTLTAGQTWTNKASTFLTVTGTTNFGSDPIVVNQGNIQFANSANTGSAPMTVGGGASATTLQAGADSPFGSGTITLKTNGRLSSSNTAARTVSNAINLDATANVGGQSNTGTLTLTGPLTINGNFQMTSDCGGSSSANKSQSVTFSGATTLKGNLTMFTQGNATNLNTTTFSGSIGDDGTPRNITKTGAGKLVFFASNTYTGSTTVSNGLLEVQVGGTLGSGTLGIGTTGRMTVIAGRGNDALKVAGLTIASPATLDIADNDLVVGSTTPLTTVEGYVKSARNGGAWDQTGLTSSAAKNDATLLTTLGVVSGADYTSAGGTGTFSGRAYDAGDTLVKYTYNGDANLDGRITFDDYVKIDTGFNTGLTGWFNGDFNYSGGVSFDDYVLIDIAFNQQAGTLGRAIGWISGEDRSAAGLDQPGVAEAIGHFEQFGSSYGAAFLAAVPEPSAMLVLGVPALAGAIRRRRRGI